MNRADINGVVAAKRHTYGTRIKERYLLVVAGFSEEDIRKVREANDIAGVVADHVPLRQRGRDFWCCCPIHNEKTPSCKVDPSTQLWHCFGCGAGGDVISFVMQVDDLDFPDAVRKLAERAGIEIQETGRTGVARGYKSRLMEVCKETAAFYHTQLMRGKDSGAAAARAYLAGRGFGGSVAKRWNLGFAPGGNRLVTHLRSKGFTDQEMIDANVALSKQGTQASSADSKVSGSPAQAGAGARFVRGALRDRFYNRIMFPICDAQGAFIAFGGRVVGDGQPKYLNSQETSLFRKSEVLYGLDAAKAHMATSGIAVVVEGYTDVIALSEAGVKQTVATLGTALTTQHIRVLSKHARRRVVYLFDGDEAGQRAADRALMFVDRSITPEAGRSRIELAAVTLPDGLDPADFVRDRGAEALLALIETAQPLIKYGIERRIAKYSLDTAEGRAAALNDALSVLEPIKDSILAKDYAIQIAGLVGAREDACLARLAHQQPSKAVHADSKPSNTLPQSEVSRRKFECEFLGLVATHPAEGLRLAERLATTQWHEPLHEQLALRMLDELSANPQVSAAELVAHVTADLSAAAGILTAATSVSNVSEMADYLAEELAIGDMEASLAHVRRQLARDNIDPLERQCDFETAVAMQKEPRQRKHAHGSSSRA